MNTVMAEQEQLQERSQERSEFVSRHDFENAVLEKRLSDDIRSTRERASDAIDAVRRDMNAEFAAVRGEISAVRGEVSKVREDMTAGFAEVRKEMSAEFTAVRGELGAIRTDVEVIKSRLDNHETQLSDLKTAVNKVQTDVDGLRRDFGQFREETTKEFAGVRREVSTVREEMHKEFRSQTRWLIGTILAAVALLPAMPAVWQFIAGLFAK